MAIRESELNTIQDIAVSDFARAVTNEGSSRKVTVANLAKTIIENYAGSNIEGSNQSIKDAFSAVDNKINDKIDYKIRELKSNPLGTTKIIVSDIAPASIAPPALNNEEEYFKKTIKKICEAYPNRTETLFIGKGVPDGNWFYEIFVYNTSEVNSEGFPRYAFGRAMKFARIFYAMVSDYNWSWRTDKSLVVMQLGSGDDLNTLYGNAKSGFYYIGTNAANSPASWASLIVIASSSVTHQIVTNGNGVWWRAYSGSPLAWTPWKSIGVTTSQAFTGEYINNSWYVRRSGNVVTVQMGNFAKVDAGRFVMSGVIPEGFRPTVESYYTIVTKEATPRILSLTITPSGDMNFYNYNAAYGSALTAGDMLTYIA